MPGWASWRSEEGKRRHNCEREKRRRQQMGKEKLRIFYRDRKRLERARKRAREASGEDVCKRICSLAFFVEEDGTVHMAWCNCYDCLYGSLRSRQARLRGKMPPEVDEGAEEGNGCRRSRDPARRVGRLPRYAVGS